MVHSTAPTDVSLSGPSQPHPSEPSPASVRRPVSAGQPPGGCRRGPRAMLATNHIPHTMDPGAECSSQPATGRPPTPFREANRARNARTPFPSLIPRRWPPTAPSTAACPARRSLRPQDRRRLLRSWDVAWVCRGGVPRGWTTPIGRSVRSAVVSERGSARFAAGRPHQPRPGRVAGHNSSFRTHCLQLT